MTQARQPKPCHPIRRRFVCKEMSKRRIFWLRFGLVVPLVLVLGLVVIAKTGVAGMLILPAISQELGVEIDAGSVSINRDGLLVLDNVRVRSPGIEGPGGEIVRVQQVVVDVDWSKTLSDGVAINSLHFRSPSVRISEDSQSGVVNISAFTLPDAGGGGDGPVSLPRVRIEDGSIELCEHFGNSLHVLKRFNIAGELKPDGDDAYLIDLDQTGGADSGLKLTGTIDQLGVEISLTGVSLDEWGPASVPGRLRPFIEMLDVKGEISNTIFSMSSSGTVTASVHLNGVAITLPINMNEQSGAGRMRMSEVSGAISLRDDEFTAEISGLLEDVPYEVSLTYEGLSADAPFHGNFKIRGYNMATNPDFVPFLPDEVGLRLQQFAGSALMAEGEDNRPLTPTAIVDASVSLWRGPPGLDGPGELDFRGNLAFVNGTAEYDIFPYPFENVSGSVQFNSDQIRIEEIRGTSHTGARISASGLVSPLGSNAGVNLRIDAVDIPLDDVMERALGSKRGGIIDELFDDRRYAQLLESGLVITPEHAEELVVQEEMLARDLAQAELNGMASGVHRRLRTELAGVRRELRTPVFEYRGKADVGIHLVREVGEISVWTRTIEVRLPHVGVLLAEFPLPIHARDVVVILNEKNANLMRGSVRPIAGGAVSITGGADLRDPNGVASFRPSMRVQADAMPINKLLKFAVAPPYLDGEDPESSGGRRAAVEVLNQLGIDGEFDADGMLLTRQSGKLGFDMQLELRDVFVAAEALQASSPMLVSDIGGTIRLTEQGLSLAATGNALGVDDEASVDDPIEVRALAELDWSGRGPLKYEAHVEADGAMLALPIEQVVASVSSSGGDAIIWLRETFAPSGRADIIADLSFDGVLPITDITVKNIEMVEAEFLDGRLAITDAVGETRVLLNEFRTLSTDGLAGVIHYNGEPTGDVQISGTLGLDETGENPNRDLRILFADGRFDSQLAERIVQDIIGGSVAHEYIEHEVEGVFDAIVSLHAPRPAIGNDTNVGISRIAFVETAIKPQWVEMTRLGSTVRLEDMSGRIVASNHGTNFESVAGSSGALSVSVSGGATPDGSGGTISVLSFDLESASLNSELLAILPVPIIEIFDATELVVTGPLRTNGSTLRTQSSLGSGEVSIEYAGKLEFEGAALTAGLRVEDATGAVEVSFQQVSSSLPEYKLDVVADSASAMGLPITNARVSVESTGQPRGLVVPLLYAESCDGLITGTAGVYPAMGWAGPDERTYETSINFSGLKLNEMLNGLAAARSDSTQEPRPDTGARLEGQLTLGGLVDQDSSRRGRLGVQIAGGNVIDVPGAMRLIEAGNFQLPLSEGIDYASVEAIFDGTLISIEGISLLSKSIELLGYGTASWPEMELDLRMHSRATRRIPVLSQFLESIRDEFITIAVTGTAAEPRVRVESLPETRRVISRVLGFEESASQRRLNDLSERAARERRLRHNR